MGGRGITGLMCLTHNKHKIPIKINSKSDPSKLTWIGNEEINKNTEQGKMLINGDLSFHDFVLESDENNEIELKKITGFYSNNKFIDIYNLYKEKEGKNGFFVCFRKKGKLLKLLTIKSKTTNERNTVGCDFLGKSIVPIVVTNHIVYDQNTIIPVNL